MNHTSQMVPSLGLQQYQIFLNWEMLRCKLQLWIRWELFRKYWSNTFSPQMNSSVSVNHGRENFSNPIITVQPEGNSDPWWNKCNQCQLEADWWQSEKHCSSPPACRDNCSDWQITLLFPLHRRVAPGLNRADFVRSGLDFSERRQVETHQHSCTL